MTGGTAYQATQSLVINIPVESGTIFDSALFTGTTAKLSSAGKKYLSSLAAKLVGAKSAACVGCTDNTGTLSKQHAVGLARALTVCKVLKLVITNAVATSKSSSEPIASNSTAKGRVKNNRVAVTVTF